MIRKRKGEEMVKPMQLQSSTSLTRTTSPSNIMKRIPVHLVTAAGVLVVLLVVIVSRDSQTDSTAAHDGMKVSSSTSIVEDSVDGVAYYHCAAQLEPALNLVLLHGAAFTKEDWKESGILDKLCSVPKLSVTALDLNHRGNHDDLKHTLDGLRANQVISSTQQAVALVTPSASGYSMVDWIGTGDVDEIISYIRYWIPVASPSIKNADETKLALLKGRLPILAIYGSRDKNGTIVSEKLERTSDAAVVEIEGGHPCYLDSPDDFIKELLIFLK